MDPDLRIHGLDSLNAAPLQWGLTTGSYVAGRRVEMTLGTPADAAAALATGSADVALIPSIELQRIPGLTVLEGICVAARRRVRSVLLLARRDLPHLTHVAVDRTSRTSVVLVRILLDRVFGVRPHYVEMQPDAEVMLAAHDAALLIADAALHATPPDVEVHDLAELWFEWTGLPFVFAVWAARPGVEIRAVTERLARARAEGLRHLPHLVAAHTARTPHPGPEALNSYLSELLHYNLGPREEASLRRFFDEAHALESADSQRPSHMGTQLSRAGSSTLSGRS